MNYNLFRGKKAPEDEFPKTQYNYITEAAGDGTSYSQPKILTQATVGHWKNDAGNRQVDISRLIGQMETVGYNPASTIVFFPEVASAIMREPFPTGASVFSDRSTLQYIKDQGVLGVVPIKDELLYTAAGANPTAALFDLYAVDMSQVILGWTIPENAETIYDPVSKNTLLDFEAACAPFFIPKKYDDSNAYIYKGVSRITAIDTSS
jgi:hypothetical protein